MISAIALSAIVLVGLVLLGALLTMVFHAIHRREIERHRANPLYVPRIQFQPTQMPTKTGPVFAEHELSLLRLKALSKEELDELILARLDRESRILCKCPAAVAAAAEADGSELCGCMLPNNFFTPECSICLNDFCAGDSVRILDCGHYFHRDCVDSWLTKHSASCPLCKTDMIAALGLPPRNSSTAGAQPDTHQEITPPPLVVVVTAQ
ncbi:hypothetical protein GGI23_005175 [Coemansia sp. RSA 2559]|nr:hypothetical protein GGI23_005175 [Coemansia sp. RSA 2559]KAJ2858820.1 hypothetical protein GGI22_003217 [Coemansia erecta]